MAALNAWIDFNGDGIFSNPDERIFTNQILQDGINTLTFTSPASVAAGVSYARFRFSHQRNLSPTGHAIDGEVEDHRVQLLDTSPLAADDEFTVDQNSEDNPLNVLANDVPSIAGVNLPLRMFDPFGVATSAQGGTYFIDTNGTGAFDDDFISYTPAPGFVGTDTFTYRIVDGTGQTDSATVTVHVQIPGIPIAIDNTFVVDVNSTLNLLDVIGNDILGDFPPVAIVNFTQPADGFVALGTGAASLLYTPATVS